MNHRIPAFLPVLMVLSVVLVAGCQDMQQAVMIVSPSEATLEVNEEIQLVAASTNESDSFEWASNAPATASVSEDGTVLAVAAGEATIAVTGTISGASAEALIIVFEQEYLTQVLTIVDQKDAPEEDGPPAIIATLDTGEQYVLDYLDSIAEYDERSPDFSEKDVSINKMLEQHLREKSPPAAQHVSLAAMQTPVRNQRDRGTCVAFAVLGAMEASYKRAGHGDLHLSAEYFHHLLKTTWLRDWTRNDDDVRTREGWENQLSMNGGHGIYNALSMLTRYRVSSVADAPYQHSHKFGHDWLSYQSTNQFGDDPRIESGDRTGGVLQSTINDFSMVQEPIIIDIPTQYTLTPMPQPALENAAYGITGYTRVPAGRLEDVVWYEEQLAAGREVVFACNFLTTTEGGIVYPRDLEDDESNAGHAMVMVGYDRRDADNPFFLVKNSWGGSGFLKLSYDWVGSDKDGHIYAAAFITGVRAPAAEAFRPQLYMGRWRLVADGFTGILDIHRDSQYFSSNNLGGEEDYRLGAFFDSSGDIYRVNGSIQNNGRIEFYLDFGRPDLDYETRTGWKFEGYLQHADATFMAGTFQHHSGGGDTFAFYGVKGRAFQANVRPGLGSLDVFLGRWEIVNAYLDGNIEIRTINPASGAFGGRYSWSQGWIFLDGTIDPLTYEIDFVVPNSGGDRFTGIMHFNNTGIISGVLDSNNKSGMTLVRRGYATETIALLRPEDGDSFEQGATIQLEAEVLVDGLPETNPSVTWTLEGPYQPGDGTAFSIVGRGLNTATKLGGGLHNIYVTYIGERVVSDKVTIVVNTNTSPNVVITSPENNAFIVDYSTVPNVSVDFTGMATSYEGVPITGANLEWEYRLDGGANWISGGTGESVTLVLPNNACGASVYDVLLRATDAEGNTSVAVIQVAVQGYVC